MPGFDNKWRLGQCCNTKNEANMRTKRWLCMQQTRVEQCNLVEVTTRPPLDLHLYRWSGNGNKELKRTSSWTMAVNQLHGCFILLIPPTYLSSKFQTKMTSKKVNMQRHRYKKAWNALRVYANKQHRDNAQVSIAVRIGREYVIRVCSTEFHVD